MGLAYFLTSRAVFSANNKFFTLFLFSGTRGERAGGQSNFYFQARMLDGGPLTNNVSDIRAAGLPNNNIAGYYSSRFT